MQIWMGSNQQKAAACHHPSIPKQVTRAWMIIRYTKEFQQ
uniref:Uncharacterized protein n=1 Tax=Setaria italica TaxID=4555 RepID=K3Z1Y5_SETIT